MYFTSVYFSYNIFAFLIYSLIQIASVSLFRDKSHPWLGDYEKLNNDSYQTKVNKIYSA